LTSLPVIFSYLLICGYFRCRFAFGHQSRRSKIFLASFESFGFAFSEGNNVHDDAAIVFAAGLARAMVLAHGSTFAFYETGRNESMMAPAFA
jgi:hypothetical protein